jgi:hypothetical protein
MAKQSKSARDDSSAGRGAAAVSGNTGTVAAAEAAPVKAPEAPAVVAAPAEQSAALCDGALLAVVKSMSEDLPGIIAELEAEARSSARDQDHSQHTMYSRLATVFGEFRAGLASVLNAPQV